MIWKTPGYPDYQWTIRGDVDERWGAGFKEKVRQAVRVGGDLDDATARGRYAAGWQGGEHVVGYLGEDFFNDTATTETYVAVRLGIQNRRWAGGNNLALEWLRAEGWPQEQVLLLNNDTLVPQGSLERLTTALAAVVSTAGRGDAGVHSGASTPVIPRPATDRAEALHALSTPPTRNTCPATPSRWPDPDRSTDTTW